jgi:hypothetical protein
LEATEASVSYGGLTDGEPVFMLWYSEDGILHFANGWHRIPKPPEDGAPSGEGDQQLRFQMAEGIGQSKLGQGISGAPIYNCAGEVVALGTTFSNRPTAKLPYSLSNSRLFPPSIGDDLQSWLDKPNISGIAIPIDVLPE